MKLKSNNRKSTKFGLLLLFLFSSQLLFAQFPYVIKPSVDYTLIGVGAITLTTGMVLSSNDQILTQSEINSFYPEQVNALDRPAIYNQNSSAELASDILVAGAIISPLSLLASKEVRQHYLTVGIMGMEVIMVTYGLISISKTVALRSRPFVYHPNVSMEEKQTLDARYSFFSGHTAGAASMTFFAAKVYSDTYPNSKWKPVVWSAAAVVPALVGWSRVEAGQHFPTDVLAGYAVGAAVGFFVPAFHLKKDDSKASWNLQPNMNGLALKVVF